MVIKIRASGESFSHDTPPSQVVIGGERVPYRANDLAQAASRLGMDAVRRVIEAQEICHTEARIGHAAAGFAETVLGPLGASDLRITRIHRNRVCWEISGAATMQFHTNLDGGDARVGVPRDASEIAVDPRQRGLFG